MVPIGRREAMAEQRNPVIFVHGYSDKGASWQRWREILSQKLGISDALMHTCTYVSLDNAVSIKDIAEAFDRALAARHGLDPGQPFDAVVHSTGMLVVRSWLAGDPLRAKRLKRLIALAPATFGSPLAKQGRSWLGAIFKGNKHLGPDFLQAGDEILLELELASELTWRLAENDLFADPPRYDAGADTPWVFVFCGTGKYSGLRDIVNKPGTDGTVRRAGCGMNVRVIEVDMTETGSVVRRRCPELAGVAQVPAQQRVFADKWLNVKIPVHLVGYPAKLDDFLKKDKAEVNHATILSDPPDELVELVVDAFNMTDPASDAGADPAAGYEAWLKKADAESRFKRLQQQYQQFLVHAVDERGDPITDYNFQLYRSDGMKTQIEEFDADVDVYSGDASYRCFHVDVAGLLPQSGQPVPGLTIRIVASSGTTYVAYLGYGYETQTEPGSWDASLKFDGTALAGIEFFRPYTTTLIRLYIERQVLPVDPSQPAKLLTWDAPDAVAPAMV
jgi:pimeloyl-ACP methyl ester carboxylesterase